jgi:hypothetical protein
VEVLSVCYLVSEPKSSDRLFIFCMGDFDYRFSGNSELYRTIIKPFYLRIWEHAVAYNAISRKVAVSIPVDVLEFFN